MESDTVVLGLAAVAVIYVLNNKAVNAASDVVGDVITTGHAAVDAAIPVVYNYTYKTTNNAGKGIYQDNKKDLDAIKTVLIMPSNNSAQQNNLFKSAAVSKLNMTPKDAQNLYKSTINPSLSYYNSSTYKTVQAVKAVQSVGTKIFNPVQNAGNLISKATTNTIKGFGSFGNVTVKQTTKPIYK